MERYVIHKKSRNPDWESYSGVTWDNAKMRSFYRKTYESKTTAERLAKILSKHNPVGFTVSPWGPPEVKEPIRGSAEHIAELVKYSKEMFPDISDLEAYSNYGGACACMGRQGDYLLCPCALSAGLYIYKSAVIAARLKEI